MAPVRPEVIAAMTQILIHRGPDAEGTYIQGPVGLGHRRLSILDLSDRARQPMVTPDGRFVLVYNGEIYNYLELRDELGRKGYRFRTDSDTEVLLALYTMEGLDCVNRVNGMFAFAIWDNVEKRLFLARDRVGIKPLYYAETEDGVLFASEAKALFASGLVPTRVSRLSIDTYLTFGYVPGEKTLFENVHKLQPGYHVSISPSGMKCQQYWDVCYEPNSLRSLDDTTHELKTLLLNSVRIHLRSDVPVGVFLSGGLDSSAMVALLAESGVQDIKTFSVAYDEGSAYDETPYAKLVADRFATEHHVLYINPDQFSEFIPDYVWYMDEPVTEAAAISLYFIAKMLRQNVTVALSGEGADELFAGYDIYRYMQWVEEFRKIPNSLRTFLIAPILQAFGNQKINKYLTLSLKPLQERYLGVSLHDVMYKEGLYTQEFKAFLSHTSDSVSPLAKFFEITKNCDALTQMLYSDLKSWLVDDLLIKADKMTMASSVELRVPFLDYRVVEYAATIPSNQKIRGQHVKWILKQALRSHLPKEIIQRKKVGFPTPLRLMFERDLSEYLHDLLLSRQSCDRGYFNPSVVKKLITEHTTKQHDHHKVLWQLVVLEEWHKRFIDPPLSCPSPRDAEPVGSLETRGSLLQ